MEECLTRLFVRTQIALGCVLERVKKFPAAQLMCAFIHQFVDENPYCILVTNGELESVMNHDRTSSVENISERNSALGTRGQNDVLNLTARAVYSNTASPPASLLPWPARWRWRLK